MVRAEEAGFYESVSAENISPQACYQPTRLLFSIFYRGWAPRVTNLPINNGRLVDL